MMSTPPRPLVSISTVFFDIGGTLIHLNPRVFEKAIQKYLPNYQVPTNFRKADINSKTYALTEGNEMKTVQTRYFRRMLEQLGIPQEVKEKVVVDLVEIAQVSSKDLWNELDDSAIDVLSYLKPKYKLGVISNNVGNAQVQLEEAEIDLYFSSIIDSHVLGVSKPDPKIFLFAAEKLGVKAEECVYIGDMFEWDGIGPVNANMPAVLVYASPESRESAKAYPLIRVVDTLSDLKTIL
jgi:putative hydrolase of the HAD superfamily